MKIKKREAAAGGSNSCPKTALVATIITHIETYFKIVKVASDRSGYLYAKHLYAHNVSDAGQEVGA